MTKQQYQLEALAGLQFAMLMLRLGVKLHMGGKGSQL